MPRTDLTSSTSLARATGATALASLLLYGGMALERAQPPAAETTLYLVATLVGTVAAVWALANVDVSTVAQWVALALVAILPLASFLGWILSGGAGGVLLAVLWMNLVTGIAALLAIGWSMSGDRGAARGRGRVARIG